MKDVSELLGCKYPIVQGAMGVISNPEMVSAVSEAGGYGLLATAFLTDPDKLKVQIEETKKLTDKPFGANLMAMNPKSLEFAEILADYDIKAVTTSGGSPKTVVGYLKERGVIVLHVVANVANAVKADAAGVDVIIAEGSESGGIQGFNGASTLVLVPQVVDAVDVPVMAAGGIGDSRGYRAAFALGAKGVQIGTRFIASKECIAHENYKKALIDANETDTRVLNIEFAQARVVLTPIVEKMMDAPRKGEFTAMEGSLEESWVKGDMEAGTLPAGQITGIIKEIKTVREIIEEMVS
jgi:enoyl-[acyl-carrier protein] reductase II